MNKCYICNQPSADITDDEPVCEACQRRALAEVIREYRAMGDREAARSLVRDLWVSKPLDRPDQDIQHQS